MGRSLFQDQIASLPTQGAYTPGTFTNTTITVNSQGIITDILNGTGGVSAFNDLTDVNLTGLTTGQFVVFDGAEWVPETLDINDASDVDIISPIDGDALRFNGSSWVNVPGLFVADIGVAVQAWDAGLDALAGLDSTGFIVQTATNTFVHRFLDVDTGSGLTLTDGDGVAGDPTYSFDITTTALSTVDPANDFLLIHDDSSGTSAHIIVQDLVDAAVPVTGATNIGLGADIFKFNNATVLEFRTISTPSVSLTITNTTDDVIVTLDSTLDDLGALVPMDNWFIVGTGAGTWATESPSDARISLGLGTMALETATDYLLLAGGTMLGTLVLDADPVNPLEASTKDYVDTEIAALTGGAGMTRTLASFDVGQNGDNSILVNVDDIQLNTTFTDNLYHTKIELNDTTPSSEGAALIGTDTKTNLGGATTVEAALDYLDTTIPNLEARFRQDISAWNLEITSPSAARQVVNTVEVARFATAIDSAIYKDLLLPPDFDGSVDMTLYIGVAKETAASGSIHMALAVQHQRTPGFTSDDVVVFNPGAFNTVENISWTIPGGTFLALDTITLRLSRLGSVIGDDYVAGADFFAAFMTQ